MKKILFLVISLFIIGNVYAESNKQEATDSFENFITCINNNDKCAYDYIDDSNKELYDNTNHYLNSLHIDYEIRNIEEKNDTYKIKVNIAASGINWSIKGINVYFDLKKVDGFYKIINTTLFESINPKKIVSFIFKILTFIAFIAFAYIITVVIVVIQASKKKKQKENV